MKKLLSVCIGITLCAGVVNAQDKRLVEITSENNLSSCYYSYNNVGVDSIYTENAQEQHCAYTLLEYDAEGNNTMTKRYQQSAEMNDFLYTDNVYYTYDESGNVLTRKNYNLDLWGGTNEFVLGGVYVYEYENALLKTRTLYWDEELTRKFETINYFYDSEGRMTYNVRVTEQFGQIVEDYKEMFEYDDKGRVVKTTYMGLDYATGGLKDSKLVTYEYDADDNLVVKTEMLPDQTIMEKHEYTYDKDIESYNTVFPYTLDNPDMLYRASKNVVAKDEIYMRDIQNNELIYVDTELWKYEDINAPSAIENVSVSDAGGILSIKGGIVELGNVENGADVRIFNAAGNMMCGVRYDNGVNISDLPGGMYMIVTDNDCVKIKK